MVSVPAIWPPTSGYSAVSTVEILGWLNMMECVLLLLWIFLKINKSIWDDLTPLKNHLPIAIHKRDDLGPRSAQTRGIIPTNPKFGDIMMGQRSIMPKWSLAFVRTRGPTRLILAPLQLYKIMRTRFERIRDPPRLKIAVSIMRSSQIGVVGGQGRLKSG